MSQGIHLIRIVDRPDKMDLLMTVSLYQVFSERIARIAYEHQWLKFFGGHPPPDDHFYIVLRLHSGHHQEITAWLKTPLHELFRLIIFRYLSAIRDEDGLSPIFLPQVVADTDRIGYQNVSMPRRPY